MVPPQPIVSLVVGASVVSVPAVSFRSLLILTRPLVAAPAALFSLMLLKVPLTMVCASSPLNSIYPVPPHVLPAAIGVGEVLWVKIVPVLFTMFKFPDKSLVPISRIA